MDVYEVDPFPAGWFLAAFSGDVETGSVHRMHYFGQEMVCYRGESGDVHITEAFCPHQGAHLGFGGKVRKDDIVCPFHGWRFAPDGSNVNIPYAPRDCEAFLRTYPVRELDGMIFVWYHPDHVEPTWEPQPVPEFNDPAYPPSWHSEPVEFRAHPQDVFENGVDAAHFPFVHRAFGMPTVNIPLNEGPHFIAEMPDQMLRSERGPFEANVSSDLWGLGIDIARMRSSFMSIIYMFLQTPVNEDLTRFWFHVTVRQLGEDRGLPSADFVERIGQGLVDEFLNDKVIWENKIYKPSPRLAENEGPVRVYREWARQFYPSRVAASVVGS